MATIILGSQWGDEGKGKMTDILCPEVEICARAAGGHNAGHSIHANGVSYDFHLLPSGLINPKCYNLIGTAVVFHVPSFFKELADLEKKGLSHVRDRIFVSDRCHVNLDLHAAVDGLEEAELGTRKIGTTGRGIGPSYSTKAARSGIRIHDIFDEEHFESKLRFLYNGYRKRFGDLLKYDVEDELARFREYRKELPRFVIDAVPFMAQAQETKKKILVEGANALMLDVDWGTYPWVTSSSTCLGGIISGLAISPRNIDQIVGIVKAYTTRVGAGIFPTEETGEIGNKLQEIGREFGVTTGRRRRCGWLDLVVLKHSTLINHYTILNLTKLDVLDTFETLKVCVGYKGLNGEEVEGFPADLAYLEKCTPVYRELKGWNTPTTAIKTFDALPKEAQEYIKVIEDFVSVKVGWIGTGPDRDDMIRR